MRQSRINQGLRALVRRSPSQWIIQRRRPRRRSCLEPDQTHKTIRRPVF